MPEAAEVSVAAAQLAHVAVGRDLVSLTVTHARSIRHLDHPGALDDLRGRIVAVRRHGKWLVVSFERADDRTDDRLGVHLRMSGRLIAAPPGAEPPKHVHAVFALGEREGSPVPIVGAPSPLAGAPGTSPEPVDVWFYDPRTFGELRRLPGDTVPVASDLFDSDVDAASFLTRAARRRVGVKAVLLDQQRFVAGIGSYLADEILHRVGVSPLCPADTIDIVTWAHVLEVARALTAESASVGGVTLPDEGWLDLWERPGRHGDHLVVHGRDHCRACGTETRRATVGGRSARWCPECQPA